MLEQIHSPEDIRQLSKEESKALCDEIRQTIIQTVSHTGGHLASNLGVVELTVALHQVLHCPQDSIVWDVGHQCYTHRLLTGRYDRFSTLRQAGGISGFPDPKESPYDTFIAGKMKKQKHAEEAFGFTFERIVLFATDLGIGTTWIAGTMDRKGFEKAIGLKEDEVMPCISPLGYPAERM